MSRHPVLRLAALALAAAPAVALIPATSASASAQAVSCTTTKYNTVGRIDCSGSGEVRIVIDCKAPQITDYTGPYTRFNGSITLYGECNFGINSVSYQARA
ncbi:hypothetical protein GT030_07315 [Streptomyces sp. SID1328]|uniref:hypothetical protein n=1 Tax=Streptomyces sp. SID1328 TaxID=2690250 RepID=UPI00136B24E4|nr:hypothetical protein [Streptomyces sp. SID1328]MYV38681.1 hypothetical protein [Streptomyces sp. SID1328]